MNHQNIAIPLKRFLLIEQCPASWKGLDLYLFRDQSVVFYVGQSYVAFARVWEHLINGFKGHSIIGRFIWCNWPRSMSFTIELWSSQSEQFGAVGKAFWLEGDHRDIFWENLLGVEWFWFPIPRSNHDL